MATQMQLEVVLIGEVDLRKSIKLIGENRKTGAGMEHRGVCTGGGEWIKSP